MQEKRFKLHYHISNNGDGSASVHLHPTQEAAAQADADMEENGDCWGEDCSGNKQIILKDGILYYEDYNWETREKTLVPLEEVKSK